MSARKQGLGCLLVAALALGEGCGKTSTGGETGSETHWLVSCESDADCVLGQCLCGVCTEPCQVALDCPAPLDVCVAPGSDAADACQTSICGSSTPGERTAALETEERTDACIDGRSVSVVLVKKRRGVDRVFSNGQLGFLLSRDSVLAHAGALRISSDGHVLSDTGQPSGLSPTLDEATVLDDGSALVAGSVDGFDGSHGWLGKVDAEWQLIWELVLPEPLGAAPHFAALPDGGAIVATIAHAAGALDEVRELDIAWARVSAAGSITWQRQRSLMGPDPSPSWFSLRPIVVTDTGGVRIAAQTEAGVSMIFGDLEGESDVRSIGTGWWQTAQLVALPEGRMAVASLAGTIALLDAEGAPIWEHDYAQHLEGQWSQAASRLAFSPARNELVLAGGTEVASWLQAVDLDGNATWSMQLGEQPITPEGDASRVAKGAGPPLMDLAVAPDGAMLAPGRSNGALSYLMVGAGSCN